MSEDSVPDFIRQVQTFPFILKLLHHAEALLVMGESIRKELGERFFPCMAERSMAEVVAQSNGLG